MSLHKLVLILIGLAMAPGTSADIAVGSYGDSVIGQPVLAFADGANGNPLPIRNLGGPLSTLRAPAGGVFEANEGTLFVADFWGQAIRVYPAYANGDVAPLRVLDTPYLGQARALAVDVVHDELIVVGSGCCLMAFPRTASGSSVVPTRIVQWGGGAGSVTQLNYPYALTLLAVTDEVALIDYDPDAPYAPKLLVFNRTDSGNTAPKRVLKGSQTQFGNGLGGIVHDPVSRELFVLAYADNPDTTRSARVLVFDDQANGDSAPVRMIAGPLTGLEIGSNQSPAGLAIDPVQRRLIVSIGDYANAGGNRLLVFDLGADGNAAPLQSIGGPQTGLANQISAPIWLPTDPIMGNGFD